jgi:hypothetical protein
MEESSQRFHPHGSQSNFSSDDEYEITEVFEDFEDKNVEIFDNEEENDDNDNSVRKRKRSKKVNNDDDNSTTDEDDDEEEISISKLTAKTIKLHLLNLDFD